MPDDVQQPKEKVHTATRHSKDKHISDKTPMLRKADELMVWITGKLCNEQVFPKRSRWLFAGKIADLLNDFETCVFKANEIKVITQKERDERHYYQTMAYANLMALDAKVNQAQRALSIGPEKLHHYATLVNESRALLMAWMNSDMKRYGPVTGINNTEGSGQ